MSVHIEAPQLPRVAKAYIATVIALGCALVVHCVTAMYREAPRPDWLVLAGLTFLTGSFTIKVPSISARISVSEAFVFAAVMLFGANVAATIVALDTLVVSFWMPRNARTFIRTLFNMSAGTTAIWIAAHLFALTLETKTPTVARLEQLLIPVAVLAFSYFAINSSLIATALGFERRQSPLRIWRQNFSWLMLNYLGGASVALLLVTYTGDVDLTALSVIVPILVITYLTFRTSLGRLEDANRHVTQLNELYLSTVETLAMAVDAKDQITHGHIRRVQVYTVELAKRLGVANERELKAVAAAALLHDMGKLAIPEHILNKPGRLSPAEFDRMKQHAGLGADLLSSIRFPYPVVPIVRHHHENWDGSGYPTGIAGTDIPLGARILSVVDCFDALTSDRPYRPRLAAEDAFNILRERRGTMYDPLVVDTFVRAYPEIAPLAIKAGQEARSIFSAEGHSIRGDDISRPLRQIRANATEFAVMSEYGQDLARANSIKEAFENAAQCLRQLTPATVFCCYRYRPESDTLVCEAAIGDPNNLLDGFVIRAGQRITGWSGATRRTSMNSDATLDLAQIGDMFDPPLRSALAVPLVDGDTLRGVLTVYSTKEGAFNESHGHIAEQVAIALSDKMRAFVVSSGSTVISFSTRPKASS